MTQLEDRAGVKASLQGVKSTTDFATFESFVFLCLSVWSWKFDTAHCAHQIIMGWSRCTLTRLMEIEVDCSCAPLCAFSITRRRRREREGPTMTIQAAWCRCNASPVAIHEYLPTFGNLQPDYWNSTAGAWVLGTYKYIYKRELVRYQIMKHFRHKICVWVIHHIKWALF